MQLYWLFTGNTSQEAYNKALSEIDKINSNFQTLFPVVGDQLYINLPQELTANPVINEVNYYWGFAKPEDSRIIENDNPDLQDTSPDLETIYSSDWFEQEEI